MLYHLRLQPSEVESMPYYEYENIVQNLIDILKEKQEAEDNHQKSAGQDMSAGRMMKEANKCIPSNLRNMPSSINSLGNFPGIPSSLKI